MGEDKKLCALSMAASAITNVKKKPRLTLNINETYTPKNHTPCSPVFVDFSRVRTMPSLDTPSGGTPGTWTPISCTPGTTRPSSPFPPVLGRRTRPSSPFPPTKEHTQFSDSASDHVLDRVKCEKTVALAMVQQLESLQSVISFSVVQRQYLQLLYYVREAESNRNPIPAPTPTSPRQLIAEAESEAEGLQNDIIKAELQVASKNKKHISITTPLQAAKIQQQRQYQRLQQQQQQEEHIRAELKLQELHQTKTKQLQKLQQLQTTLLLHHLGESETANMNNSETQSAQSSVPTVPIQNTMETTMMEKESQYDVTTLPAAQPLPTTTSFTTTHTYTAVPTLSPTQLLPTQSPLPTQQLPPTHPLLPTQPLLSTQQLSVPFSSTNPHTATATATNTANLDIMVNTMVLQQQKLMEVFLRTQKTQANLKELLMGIKL